MSTLIQSGVDIASDGLTPLLNQGSQFSVFSRRNISANHLDAAFAPLERHTMPAEAIVRLERSTASIQWSDDHWALITPLTLLFSTGGESDQRYLTGGEQRLLNLNGVVSQNPLQLSPW